MVGGSPLLLRQGRTSRPWHPAFHGARGFWCLLVVGEKSAALGKSSRMGDWRWSRKVFLSMWLRQLLRSGTWGFRGVGERQLGSGLGKWFWCKGLGRSRKVHFWSVGHFLSLSLVGGDLGARGCVDVAVGQRVGTIVGEGGRGWGLGFLVWAVQDGGKKRRFWLVLDRPLCP